MGLTVSEKQISMKTIGCLCGTFFANCVLGQTPHILWAMMSREFWAGVKPCPFFCIKITECLFRVTTFCAPFSYTLIIPLKTFQPWESPKAFRADDTLNMLNSQTDAICWLFYQQLVICPMKDMNRSFLSLEINNCAFLSNSLK